MSDKLWPNVFGVVIVLDPLRRDSIAAGISSRESDGCVLPGRASRLQVDADASSVPRQVLLNAAEFSVLPR